MPDKTKLGHWTDPYESGPILIKRAVDEANVGRMLDICQSWVDRLPAKGINLASRLDDVSTRSEALWIIEAIFASRLAEYARGLFGAHLGFVLTLCTVRHQLPGNNINAVNWHFDANFFGWDEPILINWLSLQDVGETRPGLEFDRSLSGKQAKEIAPAWLDRFKNNHYAFNDAQFSEMLGRDPDIYAPIMGAGDCLSFPVWIPHRTQERRLTALPRISIEVRLFGVNDVPRILKRKPDWVIGVERPAGGLVINRAGALIK